MHRNFKKIILVIFALLLITLSVFYYQNKQAAKILEKQTEEEIKSLDAEKENINSMVIYGEEMAPIKIKVFSSLTCPHCASFHINILPEIKKKYIDSGEVQVIHIDFPLDLAALNAGKLLHCVNDKIKQTKILDKLYDNQNTWTKGSTIDEINNNLLLLFKSFDVAEIHLNKCLNDENIEEVILENRIEAQKNYNVNSTPTIIINEKKFEKNLNFINIEKVLKKLI